MGGESLILSVLILANNRASRALAGLGAQAMSLQKAMTYGALVVGAAIVGAGAASVDLAVKFNQSMGKIAALTGTSQAQLQQYQNALLEMAPALDQSPKALADGLYFVISAGFQGQKALDVLKYSAEAAAATITPMASVTDLATTYMNAFRAQNLSAADAVSNLIKTVTYGKVTMGSLATSFGFVSVTAANAGLSANEAAAAVSALSQIAGEHGSRRVMMDLDNALRSIGIRMENVSAKAEKMKGLKAPWDAAAFAAMNFGQKMQYIAQETGGIGYLDKTQVAAYMATGNLKNLAQATAHANANFMTLVGGAAAFLPMAMLLSDKGKEYNYILSQMGGGAAAVDNAFKIMRQTTGQQLRMFEMQLESIGTTIGLKLLPIINQFLGGIYKLASTFASWIAQAQNWETLKYAIIGIAIAVGAVLAPAIAGFLAAAAPVVLTIAGIVAGGILLGKIIQAVVAHFGGWSGVMKQLQPVIQAVQGALAQAGNDIKRAFADPAIQQAWKQLQAALPQLLPVLKAVAILIGVVLYVALRLAVFELQAIAKAIPFLLTYWTLLVDAVGVVVAVVKGIGPTFAAVWGAIRATVQNAVSAVVGFVTGLAHAIVGAFQWLYQHNTYVQAMVNLVVGAWRLVVAVVTGLVQGVVTWIVARWQWFATITGALWQGIVKQILTPILTAASAIWQAFQKGVIQPITDLMQGAIKAALDWGKNLIKQFAKGISQSADIAGNAAQGALKKAAGWLGFHSPAPNVPESAYWGSNLVRMFATDMQRAVPVVTRAAQQVMQAATLGGAPGSAAGALGSGGGAGGAFSLAGLGGLGGGPSTHYHNWAGAFPNATNTDQIMAALQSVFDQRERDTYRRGRRAGMGGGLRAGV